MIGERIARFFMIMLLAPWLGHGRKGEFGLILGNLIFFWTVVREPANLTAGIATTDISSGHDYLVMLPLVAILILSIPGLFINVRGGNGSRMLRFLGGWLNVVYWSWFIYKYHHAHVFAVPGYAWSWVAIYMAFSVMVMAAADRPRPGAPGAM